MLFKHKRLEGKLAESGTRTKARLLKVNQEAVRSPRTNTDVDQLVVVWHYYKLTMKIWHSGEAFEATVRTRYPGVLHAGDTIDVLYDPSDRSKVVVDVERAEQQVRAIQDRARAQRPTGPPDAADAMGKAPSAPPGNADRELEQLMELDRAAPEEAPKSNTSSDGSLDPVERPQQLADLHDRGALTDAEFAVEKAKILSQ
jgi:hypothetical protein